MKTGILLATLATIPWLAPMAHADGNQLMVNPAVANRPGAPAGAVARSGTENVTIKIVNSCFGTNLRSVSNPLAPTSIVEARLPIQIIPKGGGAPKRYELWIKYPADVVTKKGLVGEPTGAISNTNFGGMDKMSAKLNGNIVELTFPGKNVDLELNADGSVASETAKTTLHADTPRFIQHITTCDGPPVYGSYGYSTYTPAYPCGSYMGKEGPLSASLHGISYAGDYSWVQVEVAFPGQTGFCGGYFSPLMLFFDKARPKFSGNSEFRLSAASKTYWVEKDAPGYFLALDRNGNGAIDSKEELFGDQDSGKNGFEALRELDSNKDGVIDEKDEMFSKLLLWRDANGDGVSQPEELEPLANKVVSISLKYKTTQKSYGDMAQARQIGEFTFKAKNGKTKKGTAEDIWFSPVPGSSKKK